MKKLLLSACLAFAFSANAQDIFYTDDFSGLTVGNIGTDLTGVTPGQGDYYTFISAAGTNEAFQVVEDADPTYGNVLQITGSNTATNSRFMWQAGFDALWLGRTTGNDILEIEFELYTGPATTSKNAQRVVVYDATGAQALVGLSMVEDTKVISGVAYYDNAGTLGNFLFNLGATPVALPADTWVRVGMSFNYATGEVIWRCDGYFDGFITGAGLGIDPAEIDFILAAGTGNTVAAVAKYDNFTARASAEDTLGTPQVIAQNVVSVYPNPANNLVNISNTKNIETVSITDMNGRVVKSQKFDGVTNAQLNISDLASGVYVIDVIAEGVSTVKKIVKQ